MPYQVITEVRFTDAFMKLTEAEQQSEQLKALEIVTRNGGTIDTILVVPDEQYAVTIATYADERSSAKSHIQIQARGAYTLHPHRAFPLDEWMAITAEANAEALVEV